MKSVGFALFETLLFLVVLALVFFFIVKGLEKRKYVDINQIVSSMLIAKNQITEHFEHEMDYRLLDDEFSQKNNLVAKEWRAGSSRQPCLTSRGRVCQTRAMLTGTYPTGMNTNDGFMLSIANVPADYCWPLVRGLYDHFEYLRAGVHSVFKSYTNHTSREQRKEMCEKLQESTFTLLVQHY